MAYELKLDGYRALAIKDATGVKLMSRNKADLTGDYPEIVEGVRHLSMREGVLDGYDSDTGEGLQDSQRRQTDLTRAGIGQPDLRAL